MRLPATIALLMTAACAAPTGETPPRLEPEKAGAAALGDPTVTSVSPTEAPQDTTLDVRVFGSNYDRGSVAEMVLDGVPTGKVVTNSTRYKNAGELVANITIAADALVAAYDVLVTTSRGKKGIGLEKFAVKGKPSCPDIVPLRISGLSGALQGVGGDYTGHLNAVNGNLYFDLRNTSPPRTLLVTTSLGAAQQTTRSFSNNHELVCGLTGMDPAGSTGLGVLEVEWSDPSNRFTLRYGKNCVGEFGTLVPPNRISTSRTGDTWMLAGGAATGIVCRGRLNGKANWTQVGTAGAFTMLLERAP